MTPAQQPASSQLSSVHITLDLMRSRAGGLATYVDGLARQLERISPTRVIGIATSPGADVAASPEDGFFTRMRLIRRKFSLDAAGAEVIATHFACYALPLLDSLAQRPHVLHFHGPWAGECAAEGAGRLSVAAKRFVERRVYATADRAITLSRAFARILVEDYRVPEQIVRVIPGGIDLPTSPLTDRLTAREQLGWPTDRPIVLCARRLARRMGIDVLIDAAAIVRRAHPDVLFHLAGKGAIRDELQSRIDAASLGEHVKLLGFVPDDQLALAYAAADFSVVPSQALEGFGLITLESLVQGTPVLVTPVGGLPEVVNSLDPSLVMPNADANAIAESISAALSSPGRLPARDRCRTYVVDNFGWPAIADRVMGVYREAVDTWR